MEGAERRGGLMDALSTQIASRKFETVKRGYDPAVIDAYLSKIGDQVAKLEDSLRVARSRIEDLEHQTRDVRDADTVVQTAFLAAAEAKARLIAEAEAKAAQIIAQAESRAAAMDKPNLVTDEADSLLREARRRLEESERHATARRLEAEQEAARIISAAKDRVVGIDAPPTDDPAAAADELNRLVETLGSLKKVARQGLEQAENLGAEIEAVIGEQ